MMPRYRIELFWSHEDRAWLAGLPDLPFTTADGATPEAALDALDEVLALVIESRAERGAELAPASADGSPSAPIWLEFRQSLTLECEVDIAWSDVDQMWIARTRRLPETQGAGHTPTAAVAALLHRVPATLRRMIEEGAEAPQDWAARHAA
jgi:predicted RNase H-like HicB family nuclease